MTTILFFFWDGFSGVTEAPVVPQIAFDMDRRPLAFDLPHRALNLDMPQRPINIDTVNKG